MYDESSPSEGSERNIRPVLVKDRTSSRSGSQTIEQLLAVDPIYRVGPEFTHLDPSGRIIDRPETEYVLTDTTGRITLDNPPQEFLSLPDSGKKTKLREIDHPAEVYLVISKAKDGGFFLDTADDVLAEFVEKILEPYVKVEGSGSLINDVSPGDIRIALNTSLKELLREVRPVDRENCIKKITADLKLLQDIYFLRSVQVDKSDTKIWQGFFEQGINAVPQLIPELRFSHDPRIKNGLLQLAVMQDGTSIEVNEAVDLYAQLHDVDDTEILQRYIHFSQNKPREQRKVPARKVSIDESTRGRVSTQSSEISSSAPDLKWYKATGEEIELFLKSNPNLTVRDVAGILGAVGEGRYQNNELIQKLRLPERVRNFRTQANKLLELLDDEAFSRQNSFLIISETAAIQMVQYGQLANEMRQEISIGFVGDTLVHKGDNKPVFLVDSIVNIGRLAYLNPMTQGYSTTTEPDVYIPRVRMFLRLTQTPDGRAVYGDPFTDFVQTSDGWTGSLNTMQRHFYLSHIHHSALGDSYHGLPSQGDFDTAERNLAYEGESETRFSLFTFTLNNDSLSIFAADCTKESGRMVVRSALPVIIPDSGIEKTITPNDVQNERSFSYGGKTFYRQRLNVRSLIR